MQSTRRGSSSQDFETRGISGTLQMDQVICPDSSAINLSGSRREHAAGSNQTEMEQESEGGQAEAVQAQEIEKNLRAEVDLGLQQFKTIEHQLISAPQGSLGRTLMSDSRKRMKICSAVEAILQHFSRISKIIARLSESRPPNSAWDPIWRADSPPLSTSYTYDSTPPHSPRPRVSPTATATNKQPMFHSTNSPAVSPCHTPHSGNSELDSPIPASSPGRHLDSDGDGGPAAVVAGATARGARQHNNETATSAETEGNKRTLSVKRKFMPKYNEKQRAAGTNPGNDGPPHDGHTWRKYGQKDILGSRNPRSYYRCTHKNELGCPAIKYVQRCDDDPSTFDVTYRGIHTCQSIHQSFSWPFAAVLMKAAQQLSPASNFTSSSSALAVPNSSSLGGGPVNSSTAQSLGIASHDEIFLGGSRSGGSGINQLLASGSPSSGIQSKSGMFELMHPSLLGVHQQDFQVKLDDNNPSQQPSYESLFAPELLHLPDVLKMLASSTLNSQIEFPPTFLEEELHHMKRAKIQNPFEMQPARRSTSDNSGQVDKGPDAQHVETWGIEADQFQSLKLEAEVACPYNRSSSIISNTGHASGVPRHHLTASGGRGYDDPIKESDPSEQASVSPYPMGIRMDVTDYALCNSFY